MPTLHDAQLNEFSITYNGTVMTAQSTSFCLPAYPGSLCGPSSAYHAAPEVLIGVLAFVAIVIGIAAYDIRK